METVARLSDAISRYDEAFETRCQDASPPAPMTHALNMSLNDLRQWFLERDQPAYRAQQLSRWVFGQRLREWHQMTDFPTRLREEVAEHLSLWTTEIARHQHAADGTEKHLLQLSDGRSVESVLLRDGVRRTICISTQVGCAMGCVFCASGIGGVERNLTTGEIVEQTLRLQHLLPPDERLSHVVVMGMGEPLANLTALLAALAWVSDQHGLGISPRRVTISTVGIPAAIDKLCDLKSRFHLAVSLHAPHDKLRDQLVPINRQIGLDAVMQAAARYFEVSGRRLTFEYVLLAGVNDHDEHARQLARLLRGHTALLNVIPYNPVAGLPYDTPSLEAQRRFCGILTGGGVNVQVRERKGDRIDAACGQLRRQAQAVLPSIAPRPTVSDAPSGTSAS